ncbi:MAG: hypothetical protein LLG09_01460 [Negativicutes bacterium]|nr:hypothetical protein [Negativicutes bacterium]
MSFRQFTSISNLAFKNIGRWRWRLITIFLLVAGSFSLYVLYSGMLSVSAQAGIYRTETLTLPYDLMVLLPAGEEVKEISALPAPKFKREILAYAEEAAAVSVYSNHGKQEILGLRENSRFFLDQNKELQGRWLQQSGEVVLPAALARSEQIQLGDSLSVFTVAEDGRQRSLSLTVVGIFTPNYQEAQPLVMQSDVLRLMAKPLANRFIVNYDRDEAELQHLVEWMQTAYPDTPFLYANVPSALADSLLQQIFEPGQWLLVLIFLFLGIGVLTVALMTFLERRRELAVLKSIGVSNNQIVISLVIEQGSAGIAGILAGLIIVFQLSGYISWFSQVDMANLRSYIWQSALFTVFVLAAGIAFPTVLARVATVNQLLFARNIPIITTRINHLAKPTGWILLREAKENLHFLKLDMVDGHLEGICLKNVGDMVKKGEVIATEEMYFGMRYHEWLSPCDGTVVEYNVNSGLLGIQPADAKTAHFPYPAYFLEDELHHQEQMERGRAKARAEQSAGNGGSSSR